MVLNNFIVFEGLDGSGKSTQAALLSQNLSKLGVQNVLSSEPTSGAVGTFLRSVLSGATKLDSKTIAFLFAADRAEHLYGQAGVMEQLNSGAVAISDRYLFSSCAYQAISCGRELPKAINATFPLPAALVYLDIDPNEGLRRVSRRDIAKNNEHEIYEHIDMQKKVALEYKNLVAECESLCDMRVLSVDATLSKECICAKVLDFVAGLLGVAGCS